MKLCYVSSELKETLLDKPWYIKYSKPLNEVLMLCSELGVKGIELSPPHISENMSDKEIKELKELIHSYEMEKPCLQSFSFLDRVEKVELESTRQYMQIASKMDIEIIRIFSGPKEKVEIRKKI
jgi:sugar phosphate isomerase/epimerase